MKAEALISRVNELIELADQTLKTQSGDWGNVSERFFNEFRSSSLSFLLNLYGKEHPYTKDFEERVTASKAFHTNSGRGILTAVKKEIEGGWIFSFKGLVSAEIFSDFLEMSEHLLEEGYKDRAAVMIGSVLEEHLRQLCGKNAISIENIKDGKAVPKKADTLNNELTGISAYNKLDQKSVTSWLDLRNKAAHGKYAEYTKQQVELMFMGVANFISRNN